MGARATYGMERTETRDAEAVTVMDRKHAVAECSRQGGQRFTRALLLCVTPIHMITFEARYVSLFPAALLGQYISHLAVPTVNYKINTQKLILVTVAWPIA